MQAYRIKTMLSKDGKLSIKGLPFRKGDLVEVIVYTNTDKPKGERYTLRGKLFNYTQPFDSVAEDDWETLK